MVSLLWGTCPSPWARGDLCPCWMHQNPAVAALGMCSRHRVLSLLTLKYICRYVHGAGLSEHSLAVPSWRRPLGWPAEAYSVCLENMIRDQGLAAC